MTRKRALWISLAAFAAALAVGWALVIALERQRAERRQADQLQWVYTNAHALQDNVNRALSTTHTLSALVRQFKGVPNFDGLAADLMANVPSLSGLMLAPAGTLSHAYPPDGPIPLGHNLFDGGPWRQTATRAAEAGQLALDGPTHLPGGSLGLLGALPVSLPDDTGRPQFWGLVLAVVELDATVAGTRLGSLVEGGFRYTLWREVDDPDNPQWLGGAPQPAADAPLRATVEVARQRWTLGVWPPADAPLEAEVVVEAALVVLIAGALAHLVFVLLRQPVLLQREVARKTHELHEATARRRQVEAERNRFFTLSLDLFCIAGFDGHFKQLNPVWEKTLGYPLDELKARPRVELVPPDAPEATDAPGARRRFDRRFRRRSDDDDADACRRDLRG